MTATPLLLVVLLAALVTGCGVKLTPIVSLEPETLHPYKPNYS